MKRTKMIGIASASVLLFFVVLFALLNGLGVSVDNFILIFSKYSIQALIFEVDKLIGSSLYVLVVILVSISCIGTILLFVLEKYICYTRAYRVIKYTLGGLFILFFLLSVVGTISCIMLNTAYGWKAIVLECGFDIIYLINIIVNFKLDY